MKIPSDFKNKYFSSGFFGALLTKSNKWTAIISTKTFNLMEEGKKKVSIPYESINAIVCKPGVVWAEIEINSQLGVRRLDGIGNSEARTLVNKLGLEVEDALLKSIDPCRKSIANFSRSLRMLFARNIYVANRDIIDWVKKQESKSSDIACAVFNSVRNPLFPSHRIEGNLKIQIELLMDVLQGDSKSLSQRNENFVQAELQTHKEFFDSVEKTLLTEEQRRAVIIMEDRNLLVAAAGSGKTSTVVGKVGYALLSEYVTPDQVLVLAFNNSAANELEDRINNRLKNILSDKLLKVKTFHALGLEIIAQVENVKPTVPDYVAGVGGKKMISDLIDGLLKADAMFLLNWVLFRSIYWRSAKDPANFDSIEKWNQYVKETGDYVDKQCAYQTLNGELVKSQGELAIANWLFIKGVNYEYERPYQYKTADREHRQYHPDFYFADIDCYLEHYALNEQGLPPPAFGEKYLQSMEWKRALHAEKGTDIFETYFSEFVSGKMFEKIESELTRRGVKFEPRSNKEILDRVNQHQKEQANEFYGLLLTFMKHAKSNKATQKSLVLAAKCHSQPARASIFVQIIMKIMEQYAKKLLDDDSVDFEDMIINAAEYANEGRYKHSFQLILVDEFQDISRARADLIKGLLRNAPGCKLFAVGDDWQSIYRFAGSDISIFTGFANHFGVTATNFLTQTFRSNQGIADVAARFVQENSAQVKKSVVSIDKTRKQVIAIRKVEGKESVPGHINDCLQEIDQISRSAKQVRTVYFLGRYGYQRPAELEQLKEKFSSNLILEYKTIHSSKGLQADYVVLLGLQSGKYGFPSLIADDPLLGLVMPNPETFPHAEERRLFYVALTRARHGVYILASKYAPSAFMEELERTAEISEMLRYPETEGGPEVERCPQCKQGRIMKRNGKRGPFLGCSEYPSCNYTRNTAVDTVKK